jgi:hypothetical protein
MQQQSTYVDMMTSIELTDQYGKCSTKADARLIPMRPAN